jgi:hypothetical protein
MLLFIFLFLLAILMNFSLAIFHIIHVLFFFFFFLIPKSYISPAVILYGLAYYCCFSFLQKKKCYKLLKLISFQGRIWLKGKTSLPCSIFVYLAQIFCLIGIPSHVLQRVFLQKSIFKHYLKQIVTEHFGAQCAFCLRYS